MISKIRLTILIILCATIQLSADQLQLHWGVSERQGRRPSMEDAYLAHTDMRPIINKYGSSHDRSDPLLQETDQNYAMFGIFDGHGGDAAAKFAAHHLSRIFAVSTAPDMKQRLQKTFNITHEHIIKKTTAGAVAVVALVRRTKLYLAWAGDARGVLEQNGTVAFGTRDHKPGDPQEKALIEKRGGFVMNVHGFPRVNGSVAIARALGDKEFAHHITSTPDVQAIPLNPKNSFLILACDGIWDVMSNQEAIDVVHNALKGYTPGAQQKRHLHGEKMTEHGEPQAMLASRALIDAAYAKGSTDNLSALVILFDWEKGDKDAHSVQPQTYWQWLVQKIKTLLGDYF